MRVIIESLAEAYAATVRMAEELAPDLEAVAVAPDGIVEAVSGRDPDWWLWAVQWHPENLVTMASQRALLERFRDQVAARVSHSEAETAEPALR